MESGISCSKALIGSLPFIGVFPSAFWFYKSDTALQNLHIKGTVYRTKLVNILRQAFPIEAQTRLIQQWKKDKAVPIEWKEKLSDLSDQLARLKKEEIERENQLIQEENIQCTYALTGAVSSLLAIAATTAFVALGILGHPLAMASYLFYATLSFVLIIFLPQNMKKEVCADRQYFEKESDAVLKLMNTIKNAS